MRGQMAARAANNAEASPASEDSSRTASVQAEDHAEHHGPEDHSSDDEDAKFAQMKTGKEAQDAGLDLERVRTGRSARSTRTNRSTRTVQAYYDNPYEIDRVNTRESFAGRQRANSGASVRR